MFCQPTLADGKANDDEVCNKCLGDYDACYIYVSRENDYKEVCLKNWRACPGCEKDPDDYPRSKPGYK